jgi:hypothetical protein
LIFKLAKERIEFSEDETFEAYLSWDGPRDERLMVRKT